MSDLVKASHSFLGCWQVTLSYRSPLQGHAMVIITHSLLLQIKICHQLFHYYLNNNFPEIIMVGLCNSAIQRCSGSETKWVRFETPRTPCTAERKNEVRCPVKDDRNTQGSTKLVRIHYPKIAWQPGSLHLISVKAGTQSWGSIYSLTLQWRHA